MASDEARWQDRVLDAWNQRAERFQEFLDQATGQTREFEWSLEDLPFGKGVVRLTLKTLQ